MVTSLARHFCTERKIVAWAAVIAAQLDKKYCTGICYLGHSHSCSVTIACEQKSHDHGEWGGEPSSWQCRWWFFFSIVISMGEKQTDEKISSNMMSQSMIFITKWSSRLRDHWGDGNDYDDDDDNDDHHHDIGDGNDVPHQEVFQVARSSRWWRLW